MAVAEIFVGEAFSIYHFILLSCFHKAKKVARCPPPFYRGTLFLIFRGEGGGGGCGRPWVQLSGGGFVSFTDSRFLRIGHVTHTGVGGSFD